MTWLPVLLASAILALSGGGTAADEPKKDPPASAEGPEGKPSVEKASASEPKPKSGDRARTGKDDKAPKLPSAGAKPAAPRSSAGPRVLTRSEMNKARSPFLSPPGSEGIVADRYAGPEPDWRDIPAWRQASFFGIRARGRFFVYVIDGSESMIDEDRFARATMEVRRSVLALQDPQQFEVIFYNEAATPMPGGPQPRPADSRNKNQLLAWLRLVDPDGGTDPRGALRQALSLRPEAVFLLSDGEFPAGTARAVSQFNPNRIPIHCVDLSGGDGEQLHRIARDSGGKYAVRPGSLQGKK